MSREKDQILRFCCVVVFATGAALAEKHGMHLGAEFMTMQAALVLWFGFGPYEGSNRS